MKHRLRIILATLAALAGVVVIDQTTPLELADAPSEAVDSVEALALGETADAGLFYCKATFTAPRTTRSICEGVTAGGSQHQRAWVQCLILIPYHWQVWYGPTVGVLQTSTVTATAGQNCFGGYQLRA